MRYLDKFKYNSEYGARGIKPLVFFNFDGTIAVFEQSEKDQKVMNWVYDNGAKLKDENFSLNVETYDKIINFLDSGGESIQQVVVEEKCESPRAEVNCWKAAAVALLNSKKLKVSELQEIMKKLLEE